MWENVNSIDWQLTVAQGQAFVDNASKTHIVLATGI